MGLYEDLEKGEIPMVEKKNMPAPTYTAVEIRSGIRGIPCCIWSNYYRNRW